MNINFGKNVLLQLLKQARRYHLRVQYSQFTALHCSELHFCNAVASTGPLPGPMLQYVVRGAWFPCAWCPGARGVPVPSGEVPPAGDDEPVGPGGGMKCRAGPEEQELGRTQYSTVRTVLQVKSTF